jgi:hypothetical protein
MTVEHRLHAMGTRSKRRDGGCGWAARAILLSGLLWSSMTVAQTPSSSVECDAFRKSPDGTWIALRAATVVIGRSRVSVGAGNTIGRRAINVNNTDLAEFLDQACQPPREH